MGMEGKLKEVCDKKGAKVYVFSNAPNTNQSWDRQRPQPSAFAGKVLTIVQPPGQNSWSEGDLQSEVFRILESFCAPGDVLEIRGLIQPTPDTRQLNRVLYAMEKARLVKKHPPGSKNKKPRWALLC